jgi:hypothetical protein
MLRLVARECLDRSEQAAGCCPAAAANVRLPPPTSGCRRQCPAAAADVRLPPPLSGNTATLTRFALSLGRAAEDLASKNAQLGAICTLSQPRPRRSWFAHHLIRW